MNIKIETFNNENEIEFIRVTSPYNEDFIKEARALKGKFNTINKGWEFPIKSKEKLMQLYTKCLEYLAMQILKK